MATDTRWSRRLDGTWLFQPEHALSRGVRPQEPSLQDRDWPAIDVPNFWCPNAYWLWRAQPKASQQRWRQELDRVARYKFDAYGTRAGWYRKWIELPESTRGKRISLRFWAVATIAQVWWNGRPIGSHTGMFGPFVCEATKDARPGRNLLTVFVAPGSLTGRVDLDRLKERGVTVDVTSPWLNKLPQSVFVMNGESGDGGGIWQSVDIWSTDACRIDDVFFRPKLDGGSIDVTVDNALDQEAERLLRFTITDRQTGEVLVRDSQPVRLRIPGQSQRSVTIELPKVSPKLWSPGHPNLYNLSVELWDGSSKKDQWQHSVGFRTFRVEGTRFLLNEKPYFLRGATQPPYGLAPWSRDLAFRYFELLRKGNQVVTAFNETGGNDVWCDAADEIGIGIIDNGPWTWAFTKTTVHIPPPPLLDAWKKMHVELVRAVRNHPCILMRSINDEMWFHYLPPCAMGRPPGKGGRFLDRNTKRRLQKWQIVSDVIKLTRKVDPTRPIGASGGYARLAAEWKQLKPLGIDDGDFDNIHVFNGTYGPSYLALDVQRDIERRYSMGSRPLISDQAGTGYPNNDTGYPVDCYVDKWFVPQAWNGSYVYDPRLSYQDVTGQIIKDGFERIRCRKKVIAGWLIFSNCQWFQHVYDAKRIKPYPKIYDRATPALSPVLIAMDPPVRRFVAGEKVPMSLVAVHDDVTKDRIRDLRVSWRWTDGSRRLGGGQSAMPPLDYYKTVRVDIRETIPAISGNRPVRGKLEIDLFSGSHRISRNSYSVMIAPRAWYQVAKDEKLPLTLVGRDPAWSAALAELGVSARSVDAARWDSLEAERIVIIPEGIAWKGGVEGLKKFASRGGCVLFHDPSPKTAKMLGFRCEPIHTHFRHSIWDIPNGPWGAEYVDVPDYLSNPLAVGFDVMYDMRWWNSADAMPPCVSTKVLASLKAEQDGTISILGKAAKNICNYVPPHGYFNNPPFDFRKYYARAVIAEVKIGDGRIMAACFRLAPDPVARRFLLNLLRSLQQVSIFKSQSKPDCL